MTKKNILAGLMLLLAGSLMIAACSAQQTPPAASTVDANAIYTQAAQTVQAGLSQTETLQPAAPPTETAAPTNTMDPSIAAAMTATAQSVQPGGPTATAGGQSTPVATFTKAAQTTATNAVVSKPPTTTGDKAELVSQIPADGSRVQVSASFDVRLTFKNTGTTTWNTKYALKFFVGDRMGSPVDVLLTKEVKPGQTVEIAFTLKASDTTGKKHTQWVLQNPDGVNFYTCWLDSEVIN